MIARQKSQEHDWDEQMGDVSPPSLARIATDNSVFDTDDDTDGSNWFENDPLLDLERFLPADTSRLTLKWEPSEGKIIVGINTYLPLDVGRGCFALKSAEATSLSPHLPKDIRYRADSDRKLLFRLVSKIALLSPWIRQLDLEGFGGGQDFGATLDIEDVFEAFAREESSPWRMGTLVVLRTWNCDMNSIRGNQCFGLAEDEYPEGLEEVYVHNPKGSIISSSIFKIASRSKKFNRFYVFDSYDKTNVSNSNDENVIHNSNPYRFNGSRLTQSSIDAFCKVLSAANHLLEINQLPFRELLQLSETEFCKILEATTKTPNALLMIQSYNPDSENGTNLRFPVVPPRTISNLTILATRSETLRFYLLWKRSLEILRKPSARGLAPLVLQNCQIQKSIRQYIPYGKNDLIFAMLQDSLEGILEGRERR